MSVKHFLLYCLIILKHWIIVLETLRDYNLVCMNHNLAKISSSLLPLHILRCLLNSFFQLPLKGLREVANSLLATFCHWISHSLDKSAITKFKHNGLHLFYSVFPSQIKIGSESGC